MAAAIAVVAVLFVMLSQQHAAARHATASLRNPVVNSGIPPKQAPKDEASRGARLSRFFVAWPGQTQEVFCVGMVGMDVVDVGAEVLVRV